MGLGTGRYFIQGLVNVLIEHHPTRDVISNKYSKVMLQIPKGDIIVRSLGPLEEFEWVIIWPYNWSLLQVVVIQAMSLGAQDAKFSRQST